ncbi:MAG: antibiotic biosynthesis monooxygenase [Desulfobacteraceae bacterium]|nr:antibiotic biosynthesis monooxygenase [Desulfobacteraceae bacterium]MBC2755881.1 antibiotic biosynthesis monooxygenase [Desulfobacteraceae bacterium]
MISVISKVPVKPEKKEEALIAVKEFMKQVSKEEGVLHHSLNIDEKNPNTLIFIERYKDRTALNVHSSSPYVRKFMDKVFSIASDRLEINVLNEIDSI